MLYRALPWPESGKARLKDYVYSAMAPVFRGTPAYLAWLETRGSTNSPTSAVESRWRAYDQELAVADGIWEWAAYEPLRARIQQAIATRDRAAKPKRRKLVKVDKRHLPAAALAIELPRRRKPDVSIIIPVHGQLKYTIECLLSIAAAGSHGPTFEVIIADDASPDESFDVLSQVRNLRVLRRKKNVGFIRNCNSAARHARGRLLIFLNNDTQVTAGWLDALVAVFEEESNVGAVGPTLVYPNGVLQEAGSRVRRDGSVEMIGLDGSPEDPRWRYRRDVDYVSGACLCIEASLFREMGGFDEALAPAYCEDLELGLRLRERGLRSIYEPGAEVVHHLSVTANAGEVTPKMQLVTRNTQLVAERHRADLDVLDDVRVVAFYLPQFHSIPQNDLWWGRGFTEWTNVTRAQPNWVGQYQPRLPADLGYYDLRLPQTMESQWAMAERYGVDALCYYYYWFHGERLLDEPLQRLLDPSRPAHPFCLCWANENWTRRWDGKDDDILIGQRHSPKDDVAVIRDMARYMANPAYLRVRGRPILLIYRVTQFPDFRKTAERWRGECRRLGVGEIEIALVESFEFAGAPVDPRRYGCDSVVEFPAHHIPDTKDPDGSLINPSFAGGVADYTDTALRKSTRAHPGFKLYRAALPGWDNTARRQDNPFVLEHSSPGAFMAWLQAAINETKRDLQGDERLVFVNAWNEWAEGTYLEPDQRFGHSYLEAVRNARDASRFESSTWT